MEMIKNNSFKNESTIAQQMHQLSLWEEVVVCAAFSIIIILSVGGNTIVIWIVLAHRQMRSSTNYFLLNLSLSDIFLTTFMVIPNLLYSMNNNWTFGLHYCRFSNFLTSFCISLSVFTFMAIAADRYVAIMHPLRPRAHRRTILKAIAVIWIFSALTGVPGVALSDLEIEKKSEGVVNSSIAIKCELQWSNLHGNRTENQFSYKLIYDVTLLFLQYILPMVVVTITYIPIGLRLWRHKSVGEYSRAQDLQLKSKKRVVCMMIAVVIIFAVCWLPYQSFFFIGHIGYMKFYDHPNAQAIFLTVYFIAMSNSLYNPIIYATMNKRFRDGFKQVFSCLPGVHFTPEQRNNVSQLRQVATGAAEQGVTISTKEQLLMNKLIRNNSKSEFE